MTRDHRSTEVLDKIIFEDGADGSPLYRLRGKKLEDVLRLRADIVDATTSSSRAEALIDLALSAYLAVFASEGYDENGFLRFAIRHLFDKRIMAADGAGAMRLEKRRLALVLRRLADGLEENIT